ncbi:MAG: tRNA uridine-5-carboxymethylaminomethyl(34) synthesis enzyme MnmG [Lachnospiraceae bacterium]|nr:tRNA uridine-5-carboxymethylaminomethyl(34) synthesis enzyme MnmG [Lachnospiraceae bacterium]
MSVLEETYQVIVVGAGHAGCEAALASARMGLKTIMFTVSMDSVAFMPCNPHIGGSSKGHLVREIDALGGEMGKNIDKTFLQSKMLNVSKGPAVHSLRCQADKLQYSLEMRKVLQNTDGLTLRQSEVAELLIEDHKIKGIRTVSGATYYADAVVLCTGTYLKARCLYGDVIEYNGPNGLKAANLLSQSLLDNGVELLRFKTGTPARIDGSTIDYSKMVEQFGDDTVVPFSFTTDPKSVQKQQVSCYLTYTNEKTHQIIMDHLDESPIYAGVIEGTGPRYCPSLEDKVVKFSDKKRHQLFVEPEGLSTNEMYISGASSSMPEAVQHAFYHTIPGLEHAEIVRNAYAIEYDCINSKQLTHALGFKEIEGLYSGGQFNGSSGYEEAACQGLIAGINAALYVKGEEPLVLNRADGYIGVLIDDLVTKDLTEPYRMMTSRSEYRLLLRQDNADLRLTPYGYRIGLIDEARYSVVEQKQQQIEEEIARVKKVFVSGNDHTQNLLHAFDSIGVNSGASLEELIRRPELSYDKLAPLDPNRPNLDAGIREQVDIQIKYEGYISRQKKQVEHFRKIENKKIPDSIDYDQVPSLRIEARQKLKKIRPENMGQASRILGVSPADLSVLLVYLDSGKYLQKEDNRES